MRYRDQEGRAGRPRGDPADVARAPAGDASRRFLSKEELALYTLIWNRFVASQMMPAVFDQTTVDITAADTLFRATGQVMKFDGFIRVYTEGRDEERKADDEDDESERSCRRSPRATRCACTSCCPSSTSPSRRRASARRR